MKLVPEYPCYGCGEESSYGCHGVTDGDVFDEYWCEACFSKRRRSGINETGNSRNSSDPQHGSGAVYDVQAPEGELLPKPEDIAS